MGTASQAPPTLFIGWSHPAGGGEGGGGGEGEEGGGDLIGGSHPLLLLLQWKEETAPSVAATAADSCVESPVVGTTIHNVPDN